MPGMDFTLAIAKQVDTMQKAGGFPSDDALGQLAAQIAQGFKARKDEVAILRLSSDGKMVSFLFPTKLQKIGAIPMTSSHSLAAKTIRDKRGDVVNNFSVYKHPTVFESVDLSAEEKAAPIQKIMSSPMIVDAKVVGVIQVSRKGRAGEPIGPDFTLSDLNELNTAGTIIGKYVLTVPPTPTRKASPPAKA